MICLYSPEVNGLGVCLSSAMSWVWSLLWHRKSGIGAMKQNKHWLFGLKQPPPAGQCEERANAVPKSVQRYHEI